MAFDEKLAARVRSILQDRPGVAERRMFGGLAFLVRGHMCCGITGSDLMVRVGAGQYQSALARPHARVMDFTGRPLRGMVYVAAAGVRTERSLRSWIDRGLDFVATLPSKRTSRARGAGRRT